MLKTPKALWESSLEGFCVGGYVGFWRPFCTVFPDATQGEAESQNTQKAL
jgi:hypothetical protein